MLLQFEMLSWVNFFYFCFVAVWANSDLQVPCEGEYIPENCNLPDDLITVEDYERCALGLLPPMARSYYWGASGRRTTFRKNYEAFNRIKIIPQLLRDVSSNSLNITVLGNRIAFPVGISPTTFHKFAHPDGEIATARAASSMEAIMIVSCFASTSLEEIARSVQPETVLWMQTYFFTNRSQTVDIVSRAENAGYKAIVVTVDAPVLGTLDCPNANPPSGVESPNLPGVIFPYSVDLSATYKDITWLKNLTRLPVVVKGIIGIEDAVAAGYAGANAILVSNHGGRQLDSDLATIDELPRIAFELRWCCPSAEVYVDGGIRNGLDVFKALGRGARMAFIGRPAIWGLTIGGENGVKQVLNILKKEFNETMILSRNSSPGEINGENVCDLYLPQCNRKYF